MDLNVVYIGPLSFPLGYASTKRRRYMVDYMNEMNISSHVLCTRYGKDKKISNPQEGFYGQADFYDLSGFIHSLNLYKYYEVGKRKLLQWFDVSKKNILIFHTSLLVEDFPFFLYAKKLGYKIIFDQVETSYIAQGTRVSFKRRCYISLCEYISTYAYKRADGSFVISTALWEQNKQRFPNMPLCILPNSTPILADKKKKGMDKPLRILYAGTYAPKDGVCYLVEGVKKAVEKKCDCKLIMVGKGNPKDMQFLKDIKDKSFIEYLGFLSDDELVEMMQSCDVLAMTRTNSKFANYGFPFKLSEYLSTGNIVLATKVGDVPLFLTDKKNAFLINPESSDEICEAINYISTHEEESLEVAANGLNVMKEQFSIKHIGSIFIQFLNRI